MHRRRKMLSRKEKQQQSRPEASMFLIFYSIVGGRISSATEPKGPHVIVFPREQWTIYHVRHCYFFCRFCVRDAKGEKFSQAFAGLSAYDASVYTYGYVTTSMWIMLIIIRAAYPLANKSSTRQPWNKTLSMREICPLPNGNQLRILSK